MQRAGPVRRVRPTPQSAALALTEHPMTRILIQTIAAFLLSLALSSAARAELVLCVSNASQLAQALTQASASSDSPIYIRLRSGTYQATAQTGGFILLVQHSDQFVEVSGGWSGTGSTCVTRSPNPATRRSANS